MPTRVLVVEDNPRTLEIYKSALERKVMAAGSFGSPDGGTLVPLQVEGADTVAVALKKLRSHVFDLLVVDLKIPGLSGEEMGGLGVVTESLTLDPLRPVIVITGYGSIALARQTLREGIFDFIEKSDKSVEMLVDATRKAITHRDEKVLRAGNPFAAMTGVEPTVFGGRSRELEFLEQRLDRCLKAKYCEHFLVLGNWGIGKSTLLREFKKLQQSRGNLACIVPLEPHQAGTRLADVSRSIVEGILRDLPFPVDRFKRLVKYFDSAGVTVLGTGLQFSRDTTDRHLSPQAFLHDSLLHLWHDLHPKTQSLLILLDDVDNFLPVPEILQTIQTTLLMSSIREAKILVGLALAQENWLTLTSARLHHPLARFFLPRVQLGPLTEDEVKTTIVKSLLETGVSFSPDILSNVYQVTDGHPFEMQILCHHLFNNQLSRRVGIDVWDKALGAAIDDLGAAVFDRWFHEASAEEAKILSVIASVQGPVSAKEVNEAAKAKKIRVSSPSIAKYLQRLSEKRIILRTSRGLYAIPDRMFRAYIASRVQAE